jgi:transposase
MTEGIVETIGCDLGDRQAEIFILRTDGTSDRPKPVKLTRTGIRGFFSRPKAHVVIEVGTHSRWVDELLRELGHRVTVANPRRLKLISESDSKTDRSDAELLARLGKSDIELLSPVHHRGRQTQADLAAPKSRDILVACRSKLVNHARCLVKASGERLPSCTAESFHRKTRALIPVDLKPALEPIYRTLDAIEEEIKKHDSTVERVAKKYPDMEVICQPNGVGILTGLVYLLTIEDKARFKKSRMAGAFIGLRPRKDQSGETDKQLHITKAGDPFLRRLLVNSANYILGPFGKDSDLRRWGLELAKRGGKNGRKRAKVAVARKLAVLMHRLWVTGEEYQPLGYANAA